jgi:hypothetical protein
MWVSEFFTLLGFAPDNDFVERAGEDLSMINNSFSIEIQSGPAAAPTRNAGDRPVNLSGFFTVSRFRSGKTVSIYLILIQIIKMARKSLYFWQL